ncbi:MAG: hypothetical protein DRN16_04605 [Thermoplasmata archaeon]|nr:MAG: hypothetical protein DRN16_04605 [Thermoplasmata archaeon]
MVKTMGSQKTLDMLKTLGLNSYERKLYVVLLAKGTSSAGTLSELSGVPRSRTYDVLESLADKGFVVIQSNKPLRYVAVRPKEALDRLKGKYEEEYKEISKRIENTKKDDALIELEDLFKNGMKTTDPSELTGAIKGRHAMHQQIESLLKNAKKSVSLVTSSSGLEELYENHSKLMRDAAKRGVKIRIAAPIDKDRKNFVKNLNSSAEVRNINDMNLNGRFAIADGRELLFALTREKDVHPTQDLHLWSQSDHAAGDVLEPIFEMIWNSAEKLN